MGYQTIVVEASDGVGLITLHRPDAMNALNGELIGELGAALDKFATDDDVRCVVIAGSTKAFAAGADIKEMRERGFPGTYVEDFLSPWDKIAAFRKPIIAAVSGYALGGGCELAMMCDIILASETAKFGQPEITLGVMPGAGGTQRLTRFIGKSKAMYLCLSGKMMDAAEAERCGLVAKIYPVDELMDAAKELAATIAGMSSPIAMMTKESVNRAYETTLAEGVRFERRLFHAMFATEDQTEGMTAFVEKRKPQFRNR